MMGASIVAVLGALALPQIAAPVPSAGQNSPAPVSSPAIDETQTPGAFPLRPNQYAVSRPPKNPYARLFRSREASPQGSVRHHAWSAGSDGQIQGLFASGALGRGSSHRSGDCQTTAGYHGPAQSPEDRADGLSRRARNHPLTAGPS